ncbi:hypothetical protein KPSA1_06114 [Pseudomonas syringae pv. actinidiae]|uniref:Uncharacterized protein n=1 Tax=Pseudomonas syringae pv. actinidiae TaxID=103796 RepID=A0A2V0QHM7_PSESF|nr:hypothetical protein KPSA1_06114 [Pseudomonas syringae pv. actinidiae]
MVPSLAMPMWRTLFICCESVSLLSSVPSRCMITRLGCMAFRFISTRLSASVRMPPLATTSVSPSGIQET